MSIVAAYALPHPPRLLPEVGQGEERKLQLPRSRLQLPRSRLLLPSRGH